MYVFICGTYDKEKGDYHYMITEDHLKMLQNMQCNECYTLTLLEKMRRKYPDVREDIDSIISIIKRELESTLLDPEILLMLKGSNMILYELSEIVRKHEGLVKKKKNGR